MRGPVDLALIAQQVTRVGGAETHPKPILVLPELPQAEHFVDVPTGGRDEEQPAHVSPRVRRAPISGNVATIPLSSVVLCSGRRHNRDRVERLTPVVAAGLPTAKRSSRFRDDAPTGC